MSEYLTGEPLRNRIRKVMRGKQPRMCVSFLGAELGGGGVR